MIIVEHLVKSFNSTRVLHGIDHTQQPGETAVAVQDGVVAAENRCAFVHPLHKNTVGMIGSLQREHLFPAWSLHDDGIHSTGPYGVEGLLGFAQACD